MRKDFGGILFKNPPHFMLKYSLGLDMASDKFDACLSSIDAIQKVSVLATRQFPNNEKGFQAFYVWIQKNQKDKNISLVICMEATGIYYERCALFLFKSGFQVSIILPNKAKKYLQSLGLKSKTDQIDAKGLAQMGAEQNLPTWQPIGEFFYILRSLTRQLQNIQEMKTMATNQQHASALAMHELKFVLKQQKKLVVMYDKMISELTDEILKHLKSDEELYKKAEQIMKIKGVGLLTVSVLLAETNGFELFTSASQLVSYAGYDAVDNQSGKHNGKTKMSKKGNSRIRRILHMPAFSVVSCKEDVFLNLYERVYSKSNIKMKAYCAVQKKILVLVYALWKNNEEYDAKKSINSRDEQKVTSSPYPKQDKKVVLKKSALHKVINSVDASKFDSSPYLQS